MSETVKEEIAFFREERTQLENNLRNMKISKEKIEADFNISRSKVQKMDSELRHMEEMLRSGSTNDEDFNELNEKFKTLEEINKNLENKCERVEDEFFEIKTAMNFLHEDYSSLKKLHSKCHDQSSSFVPPQRTNSDDAALRSELNAIKSDYDILQSHKNIAESKASILERKVSKLETSFKDAESNLKKEIVEYKSNKDEEVEKFKQNFNPAAKKTISVLKDEKKVMGAQLEKYKAEVASLTEDTNTFKAEVEKYKLDLFNAEKSALESSITEYKDVVDSLQKMPEKYRRKTLKKLLNKSNENMSNDEAVENITGIDGGDDIITPTRAEVLDPHSRETSSN